MHVLWILMMMSSFKGETGMQMLGSFHSQQQCQAALETRSAKRAHLSPAKGGDSFFQCSAWQVDAGSK
jgi:hypothetical protein